MRDLDFRLTIVATVLALIGMTLAIISLKGC